MDTALLRLRRPPPAGAVFAGWPATLPELDTALVSVHHPRGVPQAISFGTLEELLHCEAVAYCAEDAQPDAVHYLRLRWDEGVVDSGSSGSGVFLSTGQLVGVMTGGFGDCEQQ